MTSRAQAVLGGDRRAAARLLTLAEAGDPSIIGDLGALYRAGGRAQVLGVTGPPGAGKSTLVDLLIARYRAEGAKVAVLAVDPSSPTTQGAILGDRVRMGRHADDDGVLIRSMATRGELGGLAPAAGDAIIVLDAMGFDWIIVETVGVGQSEIDIVAYVDTIVLLQTADGGDLVQTIKAGVLEVADILVVNKADAPAADKVVRGLQEMVASMSRPDGWSPPVIRTEASADLGVEDLAAVVERFRAFRAADKSSRREVERRRLRARIVYLGDAAWRRSLRDASDLVGAEELDAVLDRRDDPHRLAERVAARLAHHSFGRNAPRRFIIS
jgi:LAO/AO transport system kinase